MILVIFGMLNVCAVFSIRGSERTPLRICMLSRDAAQDDRAEDLVVDWTVLEKNDVKT